MVESCKTSQRSYDFLKHCAVSWMYSTPLPVLPSLQVHKSAESGGANKRRNGHWCHSIRYVKRGEHLLSINELQPAQNPCINLVVNIESSACIHSFHYGNNVEFIEVVNPMLSVCLSCLYHA